MSSIPKPSSESLRESVQGKVTIVTGAARGVGFATSSLLASHDATVVLVDVLEDSLKAACSAIQSASTHYKTCDVSDWEQQVELFRWVSETLGGVDIVICNAAVNPEITLLQTQDAGQRQRMSSKVAYNYLADETETKDSSILPKRPDTKVFDINLNSVVFGFKLAIHHMKKETANRGAGAGGRIVAVGSAASYIPVSSQPLYTASKHAVLGLVRSTSQIDQVSDAGISVSMVAPWLTLSPMVEGLEATVDPNTLKSSPDDVAWAIAHAASAPAKATNGKAFWIQGNAISEVEEAYGGLLQTLISPANTF